MYLYVTGEETKLEVLKIKLFLTKNKQIKKEPNLFACRFSWGLWWCNRTATTPWPANDIWPAEWRGRGEAPAGRHPGIPGHSWKDRPQEGGLTMGHCHRWVSVQGRLPHRRVLRSLLQPVTACLPLRCAVLRNENGNPALWKKQVKEKLVWFETNRHRKESTARCRCRWLFVWRACC